MRRSLVGAAAETAQRLRRMLVMPFESIAPSDQPATISFNQRLAPR